jgi:hypothetical protein
MHSAGFADHSLILTAPSAVAAEVRLEPKFTGVKALARIRRG